RQLLRERAADVDAFVSLNAAYADFMADYLAIDRGRVQVIPHGLDLEGHAAGVSPARLTIGTLSRICHEKGLHLLVDACEEIARRRPDLDFQVRAAGYLGEGDRPYLNEVLA